MHWHPGSLRMKRRPLQTVTHLAKVVHCGFHGLLLGTQSQSHSFNLRLKVPAEFETRREIKKF